MLERSRARGLLDLLAERDLESSRDLPVAIDQKRRKIDLDYDAAQAALASAVSSPDKEQRRHRSSRPSTNSDGTARPLPWKSGKAPPATPTFFIRFRFLEALLPIPRIPSVIFGNRFVNLVVVFDPEAMSGWHETFFMPTAAVAIGSVLETSFPSPEIQW